MDKTNQDGKPLTEIKCSKCGQKTLGRFDKAFLEKSGYRMVGGEWVCSVCTGIFGNIIQHAWDTDPKFQEDFQKMIERQIEDEGDTPRQEPQP